MKIAIIGGGAAGFFAAITVKENYPEAWVVIFEKSNNLLVKVKISGNGRCNVTNGCTSLKELTEAYPRGGKALRKAFRSFNTQHARRWFESRGVPLIIQADQRVFPVSQSSQSIIDCFLREAKRLGIRIETGRDIKSLNSVDGKLKLIFTGPTGLPRTFDKVIAATGGSPRREGLAWLEKLGHKIEAPVPSLFTFNMPNESIRNLKGITVENTWVGIPGTRLKSEGPVLITHWGLSGPAILKLSAFGARILSENGYKCQVRVNWVHEPNQALVREQLKFIIREHSRKYLSNVRPYALPERLWLYLIGKKDLPARKAWGGLGAKQLNKLVSVLTNDVYSMQGQTTFKEEFVTCGGVSLESIDLNTMQSTACENLYFAGEVMDIDGITGGFNFQAAWTTAFIAGKLN